jgi:hypothetical protein
LLLPTGNQMKKIIVMLSMLSISTYLSAQAINGTSLNINNTTSGNQMRTDITSGGVTTELTSYTTTNSVYMSGDTKDGSGNYTSNTWIGIDTTGSNKGINAGSSTQVDLYAGNLTGVGGNINGTSEMHLTPTQATLVSAGTSAYSAIAYSPTGGDASTYTNYLRADANGVTVGSATAIALNANTINLTGTANINTSGNANTNIGNAGTGVVTLQSGTNSFVLNNSGTTITGSASVSGNTNLNGAVNNIGTTQASTNSIGTFAGSTNNIGGASSTNNINGTTNINTTGVANTSVGNSTGTVLVNGSAVTIGSNSASNVTLGSSSGNSTISMNGNKVQNVANGTSANDAVNYSQLSSATNSINSLNNTVNSLSNQIQQNQSEYRNGIAGVAAMNGIGSLNQGQKVNFGVGVGSFGGQAGIAVGGNVRLMENVSLKAAVATASSNTSSSLGLTVGF